MTIAGLKAIWQRLEQLREQEPRPDQTCRYCEAATHGPSLCWTCIARCRSLRARFGGFQMPADTVATLEEIVPAPIDGQQPRIAVPTPPPYRFPYKDSED